MVPERELSPEILEAARWIEEQAERHQYADCGFTASFHAGRVTRVAFTLTTKKKHFGGQDERDRDG